jgi:hypothetical protein
MESNRVLSPALFGCISISALIYFAKLGTTSVAVDSKAKLSTFSLKDGSFFHKLAWKPKNDLVVEDVLSQSSFQKKSNSRKMNVLLIIVDDMRPDLQAYGHTDAPFTPNIDRFAESARVFRRAYSQVVMYVLMIINNPDNFS